MGNENQNPGGGQPGSQPKPGQQQQEPGRPGGGQQGGGGSQPKPGQQQQDPGKGGQQNQR